ncbi:tRNA guanosine(34) transglycosylase Tgt [Sphingobacteriales bacterium CHB3]|nr:tRNA guanosine(34) transglycosylase Tgt [Sphingobacteriales bacterium CHB3]
MQFTLLHTDGAARAGIVKTERGDIPTPIFMPVGTQGTVKALEQRELDELGAQIILGNTYHLYLRPGVELIQKAGGLHKFMNWNKPILTDSGGYQVFSLSELRGLDEDGVTFKSHHDGSLHKFTPESVVEIQRGLGSDLMMVLDECTPYPCDEEYARASNEMTVRWAERCKNRFDHTEALYGFNQTLFAIIQGSTYPAIREASAHSLVEMDFEGYAIGGLSVGEPVEDMYRITELCTSILPNEKPRYLMGVGTPENILESIGRGIDMFDCVMPTRNGRNGLFFTRNGRVNIKNARYTDDFRPIDERCECYGCRNFSRAYIHHLVRSREILALQLASIHNLTYYLWLVRSAREAILSNRFADWKAEQLKQLSAEPAE